MQATKPWCWRSSAFTAVGTIVTEDYLFKYLRVQSNDRDLLAELRTSLFLLFVFLSFSRAVLRMSKFTSFVLKQLPEIPNKSRGKWECGCFCIKLEDTFSSPKANHLNQFGWINWTKSRFFTAKLINIVQLFYQALCTTFWVDIPECDFQIVWNSS